MEQKVVKFILDHETIFMKKGYNYLVEKEDERFYFINFGGTLIKYAKFYFIVVSE